MKKIILHAVMAAVLVGCSDELPLPSAPSKPGSDITFAIRLGDESQSRTIYGDEADNAFPIYWVNDDRIIVASPHCAAGRNNAVYRVSVSGDTQNSAEAVTKVGESGVQWGDKLPANFYAVYPVSYNATTTDMIENSIDNGADDALAHLYVRKYQYNLFTKEGNTWKGTPIDRKSMTDPDANQKNPDALMYAQTRQTTDGDVMLTFKPFTVAFNVNLQGYELENPGSDKVTIQEVIIAAPNGTRLVGNFDAAFDAQCEAEPKINTSVNTLKETNVIHIPTLESIDGKYLSIGEDESVNFNVFAIPVNGEVSSNWTLTVRTTAGMFTRQLTPGSGENAGQLIAGQVHKLDMPKFRVTNAFEYDEKIWMTQIPRNVYVSELSMPGAWYGIDDKYQGIESPDGDLYGALWNAGVRAFGIETRTSSNFVWFQYVPDKVVVSGTGGNSLTGEAYTGGTEISSVMRSIIDQLKNHPKEYAVLVLSYADGGAGGHRQYGDYDFWLNGIYKEFDKLGDDKQWVYQDPITPNTTVNDVAGKLIIKVNAASGLPGGQIVYGEYGLNIPGLLSYTDLAWNEENVNSSLISQMYWTEWLDDYMVNVNNNITALDPNSLYWNYTVANRTTTDTNIVEGMPSYANRQASIQTILDNSRTIYTAGSHNVWFYVGAGGNQAASKTEGTNKETAQAFANVMNNWINDQLTAKIEGGDFSPFGIVMCNFITIATYNGPDIIKNIIKMNRLFRLSRDDNQQEWPDAPRPNASPEDFSASNIDGGNAWSVIEQQ